jgi:ubiquinone/menaquinone biosynthesis C-methylase UbiE
MPTSPFGDTFAGSVPENYERYFVPAIAAPIAADLLNAAALRPGEHVLDVGCGTGIVARLAVDRVEPDGTVTGVDVSPEMLGVAKSAAPSDASIEWHQASAESMPFDDGSFDAALSQMALQFVSNRKAAVGEMHRVLADGGRITLSVPGPAAPFFQAMADSMGRHIRPEASGFVEHVFSLHAPQEIEELLRGAGFTHVNVRAGTKTLSLPPARDFLWQYVHSTPLLGVVVQAPDQARQALERELVDAWEPFAHEGHQVVKQRFVMAIGRK